MDNISTLLEPNLAASAKAFPILSVFPLLIAVAFVFYLARCYALEWRIERRVRRRVQRARAQYASISLLLGPTESQPRDLDDGAASQTEAA